MQWGGHRQFALNLLFPKMMGDDPNCAQIMRNSNLVVIRGLTDFGPHPYWILVNVGSQSTVGMIRDARRHILANFGSWNPKHLQNTMVSYLSGQFPRQSFLTQYHMVQMCISENEAYPESAVSWGNRINKQRLWGMFYSWTNKLKWCLSQSCQKHTRDAMQPCWEGSNLGIPNKK